MGRLEPNSIHRLPDAPFVHLFVAEGKVRLETGEVLGQGDSARIVDSGDMGLIVAPEGAHVLVWQMTAAPNDQIH